jgi:NAD(P)H-nitrite reductase large subunit
LRKYVIIGGGVAGVTAVHAIRQQDSIGQILIIGDDPHGYYSRPGMAYYLTGEVSDEFLFPFNEDGFRQLKTRHLYDRVTRIFPYLHALECRSGKRLNYDRLLIATGSIANSLTVPGAELDGVVKLDNLEDAKRILKLARKGRTAVVVGGGITAMELVEALVKHNIQVHFFMLGDCFWNGVLEKGEASIIEKRLVNEGVQIHHHTKLTEIIGRRGKVEQVLTQDGKHFKTDIVAVAIGVHPTKNLAEASDIKVDRGILVDQWMQTSQADIFAAGDAAQIYDPASKKWVVESLWGAASAQGHSAGLNMTGVPSPYKRLPAINVTRLAGVTTAIIGSIGHDHGNDNELLSITHGESETWRDSPEAIVTRVDYDINHLRILVGEKKLVGAVVMGEQSLTPVLQDLITHQVDISAIRSALIDPDAPVIRLIVDFYNQLENRYAPQGN